MFFSNTAMKFSIFAILCFSGAYAVDLSNVSAGISNVTSNVEAFFKAVQNGRQIEFPNLDEGLKIVSNATKYVFNIFDSKEGGSLADQMKYELGELNQKLVPYYQSISNGFFDKVKEYSPTVEFLRDSYGETLTEYAEKLKTARDMFGKALSGGKKSGVSMFINNCELNAIYDYPTRIKDDVLSDDSKSIRRQILDQKDSETYSKYVKTVIPLYFSNLMYQGLCKGIRNETVNDTVIVSEDDVQVVSAAISNQVSADIATLSKGYFKRAVEDAKKVIVEDGGINEYSCKQIYRRLKANYFFANWTVGIYCKGCKDTRLVPEYYKTTDQVIIDKEYIFKGEGNQDNYYQVWATGEYLVFLATTVGGRPSREDWKDRITMCVNAVERTKIVPTLFESDNEKRIKNYKACVERLKVTFSLLGILEGGQRGCMEYDLTQSIAKTVTDKYMVFAVDKLRA